MFINIMNLFFLSVFSYGNGIMCRIYRIRKTSQLESINVASNWTAYLRCILGILLLVYI